MTRHFKTVDYEAALEQTVSLREALPANHLARFVVDVVAELDLSGIYERYGLRGGEAYAPEVLLALLFYGYAIGVFSSRKIEKATHEMLPFRFVAGGLHPDHDTLAHFRKTFRAEIKELFVQVLLLAQAAGYLKLGNISIDGSKVHANASKSQAVSYKRLLELEAQLRAEVEQLFQLAEQADRQPVPAGMHVSDEIALRQEPLARLAEAKQVLQARGRNARRPRRPSTKPSCGNGLRKPSVPAASHTAGRQRPRRLASRKTRTNTTSPIPTEVSV